MGERVLCVSVFSFTKKTCLARIRERDFIVHTLESNTDMYTVHRADNRGTRAVQCKSVLRMHSGRSISCCKAGRVHGCIKRIHNIILHCVLYRVYIILYCSSWHSRVLFSRGIISCTRTRIPANL